MVGVGSSNVAQMSKKANSVRVVPLVFTDAILIFTCMFYLLKDFDDTDFETGLGMWTNDYSGKLSWQRHSGYTQTMDTGPENDHTKGKRKNVVTNLKIEAFTGKYS